MRVPMLTCLLALLPGPARACPCQSGDPVLTAPPARPAGPPLLVRALAEVRVALDAYGVPGIDRAEVTELRLESTLVVSPIDRLGLSLLVPLAYREVVRANLSRETVLGLADPELRARFTVLRGHAGGRHELDLVAGVDLPVSPEARRPDGDAISMEAMIASGSADPLLGLAYRFVGDPVGVALALTWRLPTTGHQAMTMGPSLDGALVVSVAVLPELLLRSALEARWELPAQMPEGPMPNTGGGLVRVGGDVLVRPLPELALGVGVRGPALDLMVGDRDPGFTASVLVAGEVAR